MVDLPKFHECMTPLLEVLRDHGELDRHTASDLVVRQMGLTPEQISLSHETTGRSVIKGRIGWASSALKSCGALIKPKRGHWASGHNAEKLLSLGRPAKLSDIRKFEEYKQHKLRKLEASANASTDDDLDSADSTPEDLIEKGINALKSSLIEELLENLKSVSPEKFEHIVLAVLAAMGYGGGDMRSMQGVPRGPDGGIDGRINEDKLGLDQIYVQAKRYSDNSVGRPTVQSFTGAMDGGGCSKGIFVTSSRFTDDARNFANGLTTKRLRLIDGAEFAKLMIQYGVGIQIVRTLPIGKIDQDFFTDED